MVEGLTVEAVPVVEAPVVVSALAKAPSQAQRHSGGYAQEDAAQSDAGLGFFLNPMHGKENENVAILYGTR